MSRLAALALAAALALGLVGCDTSSIVPGGSGDVMPNPAASQTETTPSDGQDAAFQMHFIDVGQACLLYTSPSPRDVEESRMPSSA